MKQEVSVYFRIDLSCSECKKPLELPKTEEPYGFGELVDGDKVVLVTPCKKCVEKKIRELTKAKNIKRWDKTVKRIEKKNKILNEKLVHLAVEHNKAVRLLIGHKIELKRDKGGKQ